MKRLLLLAAFAVCLTAEAQTLKVATGGSTGTYSRMLKEINATCASAIPINEQNTTGSMENMNLLTGNQVNAAFVQTDVLYFLSRTQSLDGIKTLIALHPEEVHFVALATSKTMEGGTMGFGKKALQVSGLEQLAGRTVAAWGGSTITAQVIRLQSEIPFTVRDVKDAKEAMAALDAGEVEAVIAVGGAPLGFVDALTTAYKLLPVSDAVAGKLKNVYRPAKVSYTKMQAMGIPTMATDALFVTREYKTARFVEALGKLRGCMFANLDDLKEATGTHPKWQSVDAANKGKWAWYELPVTEKPAAVKTSVKK